MWENIGDPVQRVKKSNRIKQIVEQIVADDKSWAIAIPLVCPRQESFSPSMSICVAVSRLRQTIFYFSTAQETLFRRFTAF
jgi:hypothetical protein